MAKQKEQDNTTMYISEPDPLCLPEAKFFAVNICQVQSDSSVLVRILEKGYSDKINELETAMKSHVQSLPAVEEVLMSNIYAYALQDSKTKVVTSCNRVRVLYRAEGYSQSQVYHCFLLDQGRYVKIDISNLKEMDSALNSSLPYQTVCAKIHGLDLTAPQQKVASELLKILTQDTGTNYLALSGNSQKNRDEKSDEADNKTIHEKSDESDSKTILATSSKVREILIYMKKLDIPMMTYIYEQAHGLRPDNIEDVMAQFPGYGIWKHHFMLLLNIREAGNINISEIIEPIMYRVKCLDESGKDVKPSLLNYIKEYEHVLSQGDTKELQDIIKTEEEKEKD